MTVDQALTWAYQQLAAIDEGRRDAQLLLLHTLQKQRAWLFAYGDAPLSDSQWLQFCDLVQQRQNHRPVAYILGEREFWSLSLQVSEATLIPRPDTEVLVETALTLYPQGAPTVLDLGTGTGAIALALKSQWPQAQITAVDVVQDAVELCQQNASRLQLPITVLHSHWFSALGDQQFALIVSNPPYIDENDPHIYRDDVQHEPRSALVAAQNGLADLALIIQQARQHLTRGGYLIVEHGYQQADAVAQLFAAAGYQQINNVKDYGGQPRVSYGQYLD